MKVLIAADVINNRIHINNLYDIVFIGEIIIQYSNVEIYRNDIELNDMILWYSPIIKMLDVSSITVTLKEKNGNIFYSTVPIIYVGTFMRMGNSELVELCNFIKNDGVIINNIVEIGSFQGESTTIFSRNFKDSQVYAVDRWINYDELDVNMIDVENNFNRVIEDCSNIIKIKMSSENFSDIIADNSIDFVYIDGDHSYEFVNTDIVKWKNKVKKGGFIGGHDYVDGFTGVIRAVEENFPKQKINVFGWSWLIKL